MSVVVTGLVVGCAVLAAGLAAVIRVRRRRAPALPEPAFALPAPGLMEKGFGANVGDVVSLAARELWLEDAWLLAEPEPLAAIYFAREAALVLFPSDHGSCYRMHPVELGDHGGLPSWLEHDGSRYERGWRRPVSVEGWGRAPPPFGEALLAEYQGLAGGVLWLLVGQSVQLAWIGQRFSATELERWGSVDAVVQPRGRPL